MQKLTKVLNKAEAEDRKTSNRYHQNLSLLRPWLGFLISLISPLFRKTRIRGFPFWHRQANPLFRFKFFKACKDFKDSRTMYGPRGAMLGSGGVSDGYEVGSKRQRMMESNPYFAVSSGASGFQPYGYSGGFQPPPFPVVRLRGLPFNCSDVEILKFFAGLDIVDVLLVNKSGRFTGEAFVVFAGPMQVEFALQRDRQNMGRRYVEVFRCKRQDYYNAVAAEVNYEGIYDNDYHGSPPPSRAKRFSDKDQMEYTEILKMRGLPFSAKKAEIIEFFKDFKLIDERIHIACRPDGKATGEAYVEFISAEEAKRAMSKDKMTIGSRYVELFPSTQDEARRAESRSRQ
ncbi:hypothetical protein SADUNF_Sadunf05G0073500 [Salix dunnii]|uniref:RRM domain-containing protein n=2 Tax=Saliceae TaxID=238069 RepID=A0A835N3K3_9ROSI|nr:hypothetical protein SADUNF_Sadunf05G0073500 [Salix dunnii]